MRKADTYLHMTDEQLMLQTAAGKEAAFAELYRRHGTRFLRYFYRLLNRDEVRAQDLLQDWCIRVVNSAPRFDAQQKFLTWGYTIAGNLVKNEYRSRSVRNIMTVTDEPGKWGEPIEELKDGIDREAFRKAVQEEVENNLSEAHREVFLLRFQEDLPLKDIAAIVNCSEGTVKSRLFYALKKLSLALAAFHPCPKPISSDLLTEQK
ncbi:MAG: sigma-70 family RNA polymerase sigma factor [Bacteroidia bacterium]|nr:sigma-70 family RNA polymerase sigma factor [Bacteroidia bacterium]